MNNNSEFLLASVSAKAKQGLKLSFFLFICSLYPFLEVNESARRTAINKLLISVKLVKELCAKAVSLARKKKLFVTMEHEETVAICATSFNHPLNPPPKRFTVRVWPLTVSFYPLHPVPTLPETCFGFSGAVEALKLLILILATQFRTQAVTH